MQTRSGASILYSREFKKKDSEEVTEDREQANKERGGGLGKSAFERAEVREAVRRGD